MVSGLTFMSLIHFEFIFVYHVRECSNIIIMMIHIQWKTTQPKKEWNFAICNNIDGFGGYYAKWNKSDR